MSRILEPAEATVATLVEGEVILLNVETAETRFFGLRGAGVAIWELIEKKCHSGEQIVAHLLETCRGDADAIRNDVTQTIEKLAGHELIIGR